MDSARCDACAATSARTGAVVRRGLPEPSLFRWRHPRLDDPPDDAAGWVAASPHGFRSTVRTWAQERVENWEASAIGLSHRVGSSVAMSYARFQRQNLERQRERVLERTQDATCSSLGCGEMQNEVPTVRLDRDRNGMVWPLGFGLILVLSRWCHTCRVPWFLHAEVRVEIRSAQAGSSGNTPAHEPGSARRPLLWGPDVNLHLLKFGSGRTLIRLM